LGVPPNGHYGAIALFDHSIRGSIFWILDSRILNSLPLVAASARYISFLPI
jgi:hypothetical protein